MKDEKGVMKERESLVQTETGTETETETISSLLPGFHPFAPDKLQFKPTDGFRDCGSRKRPQCQGGAAGRRQREGATQGTCGALLSAARGDVAPTQWLGCADRPFRFCNAKTA